MGSTTLVPLAEYLRTSYRPDVDYLEGELLERNMGERPHNKLQVYISTIFVLHPEWDLEVLTEQRLQVRANRYRIPDVCAIRSSDPPDLIIKIAPVLCVEILSSEDSLKSLRPRIDDYFMMGVDTVWVLDPWKRLAYYAEANSYLEPEDGFLRIPGTEVAVSISAAFAFIDKRVG